MCYDKNVSVVSCGPGASDKVKALIAYKTAKSSGAPKSEVAALKQAYLKAADYADPSWIPGIYSGPCPCCGQLGHYRSLCLTWPPTSTVECPICNLKWTCLGYIGVVEHDWQGGSVQIEYSRYSSLVAAALQHGVWYSEAEKNGVIIGVDKLLAETLLPPEVPF
jgi:hypothetical protein